MIDITKKNFLEKHDYPWFVRLVVDVRNPDAVGLPSDEESERLNEFEDDMTKELRSLTKAVYIGRYTNEGLRTMMFYVKSNEDISSLVERFEKDEEADIFLQSDPEWEEVQHYFDQLV